MKIEMSLKDFFDSFITRSDFEVSIYENEKLLVDFESVNWVLNNHKNLLNRKIDYIDLDAWNDMAWLMIVLKGTKE